MTDAEQKIFTCLRIERKASPPEWEVVAYPKDDIEAAKSLLCRMRRGEELKKFGKALRLVRVTREYIDA